LSQNRKGSAYRLWEFCWLVIFRGAIKQPQYRIDETSCQNHSQNRVDCLWSIGQDAVLFVWIMNVITIIWIIFRLCLSISGDAQCTLDARPVTVFYNGTISSPNFPQHYPNDSNCQWVLIATCPVSYLTRASKYNVIRCTTTTFHFVCEYRIDQSAVCLSVRFAFVTKPMYHFKKTPRDKDQWTKYCQRALVN
jgi:hypothetical protein